MSTIRETYIHQAALVKVMADSKRLIHRRNTELCRNHHVRAVTTSMVITSRASLIFGITKGVMKNTPSSTVSRLGQMKIWRMLVLRPFNVKY